jgi:hypothetical protein
LFGFYDDFIDGEIKKSINKLLKSNINLKNREKIFNKRNVCGQWTIDY